MLYFNMLCGYELFITNNEIIKTEPVKESELSVHNWIRTCRNLRRKGAFNPK